ncbi:MAG: radical SAM peptide maturase, CXXX-repeat target family [Emergencia sp.]
MSKKIEDIGSKIAHFEFPDIVSRLYPELHKFDSNGERTLSRTVTFQVTDECNLACTYCYQINKGTRRMSLDTAKKMIDELLEGNDYVNTKISPFIILEFIGGEPLLEITLIDQIVDYFKERTFQLMHPWADKYIISMCSNGTLYFNPKVQEFLAKHRNHLSFSITIDGDKELHDSCRVFKDGRGSYDIAMAAADDWRSRGFYLGSKVTIAPGNINHVYSAIVHMIEHGYKEIFANCVYEKGWTIKHAQELYNQLKRLADYLIENDLTEKIYISILDPNNYTPMMEDDNNNWCGGTGFMLSCDPDGYYYPCIRYMESSLGDDQKPLRLGHVDTGICEKETIKCLSCITRRSQSTDECFYCPIAKGCAWCSAYNYQVFGTVNKRATYICEMHKARSLANVYYWNKAGYHLEMHCPEKWAVPIIGQEEYNYLKELETSE